MSTQDIELKRFRERILALHAALGHASDEYVRGRLTEEQYSYFVDELQVERAALRTRAGLPNDEI